MSGSIDPQNDRELNKDVLHFWSKFGDPSLTLMHNSDKVYHRPDVEAAKLTNILPNS